MRIPISMLILILFVVPSYATDHDIFGDSTSVMSVNPKPNLFLANRLEPLSQDPQSCLDQNGDGLCDQSGQAIQSAWTTVEPEPSGIEVVDIVIDLSSITSVRPQQFGAYKESYVVSNQRKGVLQRIFNGQILKQIRTRRTNRRLRIFNGRILSRMWGG